MPLPLLQAKKGAAEMRKAVGPVIEALLGHVNRGVEPKQQMSLLDVAKSVMGSRQVSGWHAAGGTHLPI